MNQQAALPSFRRFAPDMSDIGRWPVLAVRACLTLALAERERWPLWLPVGFGAGIGFYFALPFEPPLMLAVVLGVAGLASAIWAVRSARVAVSALLAVLAALTLGFAVAKWRTETVVAPVLTHKIGPVGLDGRIETVQVHGKGVRIVLGALSSRRFGSDTTPSHARVSIRAANDVLVPGNWIHLTAVLMPPPGPAAPGGYDFGRAAFFDRIGAVGYAYGRAKPIAPLPAKPSCTTCARCASPRGARWSASSASGSFWTRRRWKRS